MAAKRLLSIGSPLLDILSEVEEPFLAGVTGSKGGRELMDSVALDALIARLPNRTICSGGAAGNTAAALAQLGGNSAFFGRIGADEAGRFYREGMRHSRCDVSRMREDRENPTGRCVSLITPDGERTMRSSLGASAFVTAADAEALDWGGFSVVFWEGFQLAHKDFFTAGLARAREAGCKVALDLSSFEVVSQFRDTLQNLWESGGIDILFANREEAEALLGSLADEELTRTLGRHSLAVLKRGAEGAVIAQKSEMLLIPAQKTEVHDTTGAGDFFAAGFFYGYLQDVSLAGCGAMGAAVAAEVVQHIGAAIPQERYPALCARLNEILHSSTQ